MRTGRIFPVLFFLLVTCRITAQNVGIGTTTPTERLHVQGNTYTSGITRTEAFAMGGLNTFNVNTQSVAGGRFFIGESGLVGIGTNTPQYRLDVNGIINASGFRLANGALPGYIFQTDGTGEGSWVNPNTIFSTSWTVNGPHQYSALDGNVGIGTTNPTGKLTVAGNIEIKDGGQIFLENSNVRGLNTLEGAGGLYLRPNSGSPHLVNIDPNGGVGIGIGTNAPSKKLEVNGEIKAAGLQLTNSPVSGYILKTDANGNSSWADPLSVIPALTWTPNGNNQFSALSGNVGIGTNNPTSRLTVSGNIELRDVGQILMENSNVRGVNTVEGANGLYLRANPGNNNLVNIDPNGNVGIGIGTAGPSAKLEVNGAVKSTGFQMTTGAGAGKMLQSDAAGNAAWADLPASGNTWTGNGSHQFSAVSGNVGIGTSTPSAKLEVAGNIRVSNNGRIELENNHINGLNTLEGTAGLYLRANPGNANLVNIDPNGNVGIGIGTSPPQQKLEVNGTVKSTGFQMPTGAGAGKVLQSDAAGNASWVDLSSGANAWAGSNTHALTVGNQFVSVDGDFSVSNGAKNFVTDHPLDPANKTLRHSCMESPEVLNVYSGTAVLGAGGKATVQLPDYFEALNRDFRYQLTCIGAFAPVFVAQEVTDNQFVIAGGAEGMKVSWQVTGVRNDPWFRDHPYQPVTEKTGADKGRYYYPEGYGQPAEKSISRHAETTEK